MTNKSWRIDIEEAFINYWFLNLELSDVHTVCDFVNLKCHHD